MQSWGSDLQVTLSDGKWLTAIHYSWGAQHCINHWEPNHKIMHMLVEHVTRWVIYFIPYLTSLCPQTFRLISDVTEVSIPPDPTLAFLNIPVGIECFHTILRWYLTHYRLAKFYLNQSLVCWRGCDQVGNLLLHLTSFWCQTFQLISRDTGVSISPDPTL